MLPELQYAICMTVYWYSNIVFPHYHLHQALSHYRKNIALEYGINTSTVSVLDREEGSVKGKQSASNEKAKKFILKSKNRIKSKSYDKEFIYNADESGFNWCSLLRQPLASAPGTKVSRIAILLCAIVTGNQTAIVGNSTLKKKKKKISGFLKCENSA